MTHFVFLFLVINSNCLGQNYIDAYKTINRAEIDFDSKNYMLALTRYDSIKESFSYVNATSCYNALQSSIKIKDTTEQSIWLEECEKKGVPEWVIQKLFEEAGVCFEKKNVYSGNIKLIQSKHNNFSYGKIVDSLYYIDQNLTSQLNDSKGIIDRLRKYHKWRKNCRKNYKQLKTLILEFGYPGEKNIGIPMNYLDSNKMSIFFKFYGTQFKQYQCSIMLIHYYSSYRIKSNKFLNILEAELIKGNIFPEEYAMILDMIEFKSLKINKKYFIREVPPKKIHNNENRYKIGLKHNI